MGNKPSTVPFTPPVHVSQKNASRRNSDYRGRATETPNLEGRRWSSAGTTQRSLSIKPKRVSPRHRNLIIKSWSKINKPKVARDTFVELFKTSDDVRSMFAFGGLPIKRLRQDDRFLAHCERFVAALDHVIAHLDEIGAVIESAEALGMKHASLAKAVSNEHWQMFADILVERIIENDTKQLNPGSEVHTAWKMLAQLLVFYMRLGYDRETLRNARNNRFLEVAESHIDRNHLYIPDRGVPYA